MANEINFIGDPVKDTGKTFTFRLVRTSDGSPIAGGLQPMTELVEAGALGIYTGDIPAAVAASQEILVRIYDDAAGTNQVGIGSIFWDGAKEVTPLTAQDLANTHAAEDATQHAQTQTDIAALPTAEAVNAEVDQALVDADVATSAEVAAAQTALVAENDATQAAVAGLNNLSPAEVKAEVDTALADYDSSTRAENVADRDTILAAVAGQATPPTAAEIADQVWDEAAADHTTAGSMGATQPDQDLSALATGADIAALPTPLTAAEVNAEADAALADHGAATAAEVAAAQAAIQTDIAAQTAPASAADIADAVWDEAIADHVTAGSAGARVSNTRTDIENARDDVQSDLAALNDLDAAEVLAEATQALVDHDAPTNADLTAVETNIAADIAAITIPTVTSIASAVWAETVRSLTDKADFTLATSDHVAIANSVQAAIIDEGDGNAVIDAIVQLINTNLDLPALELAAITNAFRVELAPELARLDIPISDLATPADVDNSLAAYGAATPADIIAARDLVLADIAALNDLDAATVKSQADQAIIDAALATVSDVMASEVALAGGQTALSALISALENLSAADVTSAVPTTTEIAVGVWNALIAANMDPGTTGEALSTMVAAGGAPTATTVAAAVWDALAAAHTAPGTMGATQGDQDLSALATSAEISDLNNLSAADVKAQTDQALLDANLPSATGLTAAVNMILSTIMANVAPTADAVADAVWDEPRNAHVIAGSMGETQGYQDLSVFGAGLQVLMNQVAALNNIDEAGVVAALGTYDAVTQADLDAARTFLEAVVAGLNDLDPAAITLATEAALGNFNAVNNTGLVAVQTVITDALATQSASANTGISEIIKVLVNNTITDPVTGIMTLFDDDGVTPLRTWNLFEDVDGLQTYRGQGAERKDQR